MNKISNMFSRFIFFLFSLRTHMSKSQLSNTYPAHAGADIRRKTETEPSAVVPPELLLLLLLLLRCRLRCCGGSTRPHRYTDTYLVVSTSCAAQPILSHSLALLACHIMSICVVYSRSSYAFRQFMPRLFCSF